MTGVDCATPGNDGTVTALSGVVNTYYPGTASAAAGARCISVGTPTAGAAIAAGDLLLVIQMQHATINSVNGANYGDGAGGLAAAGVTNYLSSGRYEYVAALGAVGAAGGVGCTAGQVPVRARNAGGGLLNAYTSAARSGTTGRATFQVVRVPQYRNATLAGDVTAAFWNGATGGVLALDVTGTLNLNGRALGANGRGFRGGGGRGLSGGTGADTDFRTLATDAVNGSKGEGIAGTPRYTFDQSTFNAADATAGVVLDNTDEGYDSGSYARGAPGNAGGGGTDGAPAANDENTGGGGGGNGGAGGLGGNAWFSQDVGGGFGGAAFGSGNGGFAATLARLVAGGGGGAATRNNSSAVMSSGGAGGGIVLVQAGLFAGSGAIESNGGQGPAPLNDGGGGGGAGGTIVLRDNTTNPFTTLAGVSVRANGAAGSNAWQTEPAGSFPGTRHGPGGGGGGGVVWRNTRNVPLLVQALQGAAGTTTTAADTYGALPGAVGVTNTFTDRTPGIVPGFECATVPVTLSHFQTIADASGVEVRFGTATETQNVGFRLYAEQGAKRVALPVGLIASKAVNSAEPQKYSARLAALAPGTRLWLADVDVRGRETLHGPFAPGARYGAAADEERIDWASLRADFAQKSRLAQDKGVTAAGAKAWVSRRGLQRVTHEALLAAGVDFSGVPTREIAVRTQGRSVQRMVTGGPLFGPGSAVVFFGEPLDSLYSFAAPYLVERAPADVREVPVDSALAGAAAPAWAWSKAQYAPRRQYNFAAPGDDPWFADRLLAYPGSPAAVDVPFALDAVAALPRAQARLSVALHGVTDWPALAPDHRVSIAFDGQPVANLVNDGVVAFGFDSVVALGATDGVRSVRVAATGDTGYDFDVVNLHRAALEYPRLPRADAGQWLAEALQVEPVPANAFAGALPGGGSGGDALYEDGFEETVSSPFESFIVRGLPSAPVLAWAADAGGWRAFSEVRTAAAPGGGLDAFVPRQRGAAYAVASLGALPAPRLEALEPALALESGPIDYLMIAPAAFHDALAPLVAARRAQGLAVAVVDVAQVFRQFGASVPDAAAVASFVRDTAAARRVRYVLLAGGDTYDYNDWLGHGSMSFVPTLYAPLGEVARFAPADSLYGDLDGDAVPEIAVGRLPARSAAELAAVVANTLAYGNGNGARDALMVAGAADLATSFRASSEDFALSLPGAWRVDRAYVDDLGPAGARAALLDKFNRGPALVSFFGHSAPSQWTFDPLFTSADARALGNAGRPSVVLQWGCWNTYFVSPQANTLGHALLLSGDRGAAAAFGATSLSSVSSHQALANALLPRLTPGTRLGDALIAAKREVAAGGPARRDVVVGTALLGDPALILR